jgi:hypothetical protein
MMRALMRRTEAGKAYGVVTAKALAVLNARCSPSSSTAADRNIAVAGRRGRAVAARDSLLRETRRAPPARASARARRVFGAPWEMTIVEGSVDCGRTDRTSCFGGHFPASDFTALFRFVRALLTGLESFSGQSPGSFFSASGAPTFVTPFRDAFHVEIRDPTGRGRGYPLILIARGLKCVWRRVPMCGKFLEDHLVTVR